MAAAPTISPQIIARIRAVSLILLVLAAVQLTVLIATADGLRDGQGRPLGADFFSFWSAGKVVAMQGPSAAYDLKIHYAAHQDLLGTDKPPFYPWLYPPTFLAIASLLAALPYLTAWLSWAGGSLIAYLAAIRLILPQRLALLAAAAFPAVFVTIIHGQTALVIAALFAGALALLQRRPILAGILIGLLTIKPQFGVLIPIALLLGGHWRTIASATTTALAMGLASLALYGPESWLAFFHSSEQFKSLVLEPGAIGWHKMQSVFAALRMWGAPLSMAYAGAIAAFIFALLTVVKIWRSDTSSERKSAVLIAAALIASPYSADYDLALLGPAIAFAVADGMRRGFGPRDQQLLAFVWFAPLFARPVGEFLFVPLGVIATGLFLLRYAWPELTAPKSERYAAT